MTPSIKRLLGKHEDLNSDPPAEGLSKGTHDHDPCTKEAETRESMGLAGQPV